MRWPVLIAGSLLLLSSCAHSPELTPDPSVPRAPGNDKAALVDVAGIRLAISPDDWKGDPSNLTEVFTPLYVTIENASGKPLRISYADFALSGASGFRYAAIPPLAAKGAVVSQVAPVQSRFYADRFFIAEHYSPYYPAFSPWVYPLPYDPLYYDRYYAYWPEPLPTRDMLAEALPEGAVQDHGRVAGFLYFQSVVTKESQATFEMNLIDASNGQPFGKITIPFIVKR